MSSETRWLLPGQVIYTAYSSNTSLKDIEIAIRQQQRLLEAYPDSGAVHLIIDSSETRQYPRNIAAIRPALRQLDWSRIGWMVVLSEDFYHRHLAAIFARLNGVRLHHAPTLKQAYRFLSQVDSLPLPHDWPDNTDDTMPQRPIW